MKSLKMLAIISILIFSLVNLSVGQKVLKCDLNQENWCVFKNAEIGNDELVAFDVNGGDKNAVKSSYFSSSSIFYIPGEFFFNFPKLEMLALEEQNLMTIKPGSFQNATNLNYLDLIGHKIMVIKEDVFQGATNLMTLDLCCGQLIELGKNSLKSLPNLQFLTLSGNQLKIIHKDAFKGLTSLRKIGLENNQLQYLHPELFADNFYLESVSLNANRLKGIARNMFSHLKQLKGLWLSGNVCVDKVYDPTANKRFQKIEKDLDNCHRSYFEDKTIFSNDNFDFIDEKFSDFEKRLRGLEESVSKILKNLDVTK